MEWFHSFRNKLVFIEGTFLISESPHFIYSTSKSLDEKSNTNFGRWAQVITMSVVGFGVLAFS